MSFKNTIFIVVFLLIAVLVYYLYKGINDTSQNSSSLTIGELIKTSDSSKSRENIPHHDANHDSVRIIKHDEAEKDNIKRDGVGLIVYYFHATARCTECINIENFTKEIVERGFSKEKKSVKMTFRSLNIEDSVNEHYVNDFKLNVSTVILSKIINKKQVSWKNLEHVWKYADDKTLFFRYIKNGIKDFLNQKEEI